MRNWLRSLPRWTIHAVVLGLLSGFVALVWSAAAQKSETIDEGLFIGGGVAQIRTTNPNFDLTHPPLLRWVAGLPAVMVADARIPPNPPFVPHAAMSLKDETLQQEFDWAQEFFYAPENDHDAVLFWGRFPFALLAALAGWLVFHEARARLGTMAGLATLVLFLFTPEVLAHAQWAHSDIAAALTTLVVALALAPAIDAPSWRNELGLGAALGVAALAKLTALVLVPMAVVLALALGRASKGPRALLLRGARILLPVWVVIVLGWLPDPRILAHPFTATDLAALLHSTPDSGLVNFTRAAIHWIPLPDTFLKGVAYTTLLSERGQVAFFHGETAYLGWWYYYPVAIFLKYPLPLLLLALVGAVLVFRSEALSRGRRIAWLVPPFVILVLAMNNHVNIGVRSVLPIAPFLALWGGVTVAGAMDLGTRWREYPWLAWGTVALSAMAGIASYPNFLTWFNPLMGGTPAAHRWLVDSNLDWGQDLPALAEALERREIDEVHLAYFGAARLEHWGIENAGGIEPVTGWWAVSRSYLSGWWPPNDPYRWLREIEPVELVGGSIALIYARPEDVPTASDTVTATGPEGTRSADSRPDTIPVAATTSVDLDSLMAEGVSALHERRDPAVALSMFDRVLELNPHHYGALWQRAFALDALGRGDEALSAWVSVLAEASSKGYTEGVDHARKRIESLLNR